MSAEDDDEDPEAEEGEMERVGFLCPDSLAFLMVTAAVRLARTGIFLVFSLVFWVETTGLGDGVTGVWVREREDSSSLSRIAEDEEDEDATDFDEDELDSDISLLRLFFAVDRCSFCCCCFYFCLLLLFFLLGYLSLSMNYFFPSLSLI